MSNTVKPNHTTREFVAVCQGHGGRCADPECDTDHGVVSYCDGTCAEARWAYEAYLRTHSSARPVPSDRHIALEMFEANTHNPTHWVVRFEGPDAETWALAYIEARWSTHAMHELPSEPFSYKAYPRLTDKLYPTCEHGLSADLCEGPNHYPTREQEMSWGW